MRMPMRPEFGSAICHCGQIEFTAASTKRWRRKCESKLTMNGIPIKSELGVEHDIHFQSVAGSH
jgi:hypothetical protein